MPLFNYSSGNPSNLTGGSTANMADIQGPFTDLRTAINGQLDETNVPNLAAAFTTYRRVARGRVNLSSAAVSTNTYGFDLGPIANNARIVDYDVGVVLIDLDPAEFAANARVTKLNLRLTVVPNAVAPAVTFTGGLYPISTYAGASGVAPVPASIGAVVTGSTVPIATPAAVTRVTATSGDFNIPAAGAYAMGVTVSGTPAAGSITALMAELSMRQV